MDRHGIRDLQRNPGKIVDEVERTGRPALVTRHGRAAAVLMPVDDSALEDHVLANAPEYVASRQDAEDDAESGRTRSLDDVLDEFDA